MVDLESDLNFGDPVFFINNSITIFTIFVLTFGLARFSLKKPKSIELSIKEIINISLVVSVYGILYQLLMDPTATALGLFYYRNPPVINIFGFPIWFITSFAVYGLYAFIFLLVERYYFQKFNK